MFELRGCQMIQQSPNHWSCMPTALAMVLHVPVREIVAHIGHDGSEIAFPLKDEPERRRGFHLQELVWVCWKRDYWAIVFEAWPVLATTRGSEINWEDVVPAFTTPQAQGLVNELMRERTDGIFCGITKEGCRHAIARVNGCYACPNHGVLEGFPNDFKISHFMAIGRIR